VSPFPFFGKFGKHLSTTTHTKYQSTTTNPTTFPQALLVEETVKHVDYTPKRIVFEALNEKESGTAILLQKMLKCCHPLFPTTT
jgi:hypothetical protein